MIAQVLSLLLLLLGSYTGTDVIVKSHHARAVIVVSASAPAYVRDAAQDFQYHVRKSTGILLDIRTDKEIGSISSSIPKIFIGKSEGTLSFDDEAKKLIYGEFWIKKQGNNIYFLANDNQDCPAVHYAVCEWLEKSLNAKWLWPGDLGTYVDKKSSLRLGSWDYRWHSSFDVRFFSVVGLRDDKETRLWLTRHRLLLSSPTYSGGSVFEDWKKKYKDKYPEIFAKPPKGLENKFADEEVKFNLNSPKFIELIYEEWQNQGKPEIFDISPTDGIGFDAGLLPNENPKDVYLGKIPLTRQYLGFYTRVDDYFKARGAHPRFNILAYSAYRTFPDNFKWDGRDFNLFCCSPNDSDNANWSKWAATGVKMYLRPNWWWSGPMNPYLRYQREANFFNYCKKTGMKGFFFDAILNEWSVQGLNYYTIARLSYRDLSPQQILAEYLLAFGKAKKDVGKYICSAAARADAYNQDSILTFCKRMDLKALNYANPILIPIMYPGNKLDEFSKIVEKGKRHRLSAEEKKRLEWLQAGLFISKEAGKYISSTYNKEPDRAATLELRDKVKKMEEQYPYSFNVIGFLNIAHRYVSSGLPEKK